MAVSGRGLVLIDQPALPARRELGAVGATAARPSVAGTDPGVAVRPGDSVEYTPTEPLLVVEVDTDICFDHHRWRHSTALRRVRAELHPVDLSPPGRDEG